MVNINIGRSPQRTPNRGGHDDGSNVAVVVAAGIACASMWTLFALALPIFVTLGAFAGWTMFLMMKTAEAKQTFASGCVGLSLLGTMLINPLSLWLHLVPYPIFAAATVGLYVIALFTGALSALEKLWQRLLAILFAVAVAGVLFVLPPPDAGAANDEASKWTIVVRVRDADGRPIAHANAQCTTAMAWEHGRRFDAVPGVMKETGESGEAEFDFHGDTLFKGALCGAFRLADDTEQGYALRAATLINPFRGGRFPLTITLNDRTDARDIDTIETQQTPSAVIDARTAESGVSPPQ